MAKLGRCKQTAREIESRVAESEKMQEKIESTRKKYLPVSGMSSFYLLSVISSMN